MCLRTIPTGILSMVLVVPPFTSCDVAESAQELTGGLLVLLSGGIWLDRAVCASVGAVTSSIAMA